MKQIYIQSYFKSGYHRLMDYIYNISNHPKKPIIEKRLEIIKFFDEYSAQATKQAFGKSRSTIYLWKHKLKKEGGKLSALAPDSTKPHTYRENESHPLVVGFIENYRNQHYGVGKETIYPELLEYCLARDLPAVSESTIGRIIARLKEQGKLPKRCKLSYYANTGKLVERNIKKTKKLRRKGYMPQGAGDLMQIDAIELFMDGTKRYIITAIDVFAKFAFAYGYKSLSSLSARDFMEKLIRVAPFSVARIQTDNGKEFHKYFAAYVNSQTIVHFYNYPRCPKMNTFIENFNGTIQRQFIDWHQQQIKDNIVGFNVDLMEYLLWYNTKKQHSSIGKIPPLRYYVNTLIDKLNLPSSLLAEKSNMLWTGA